MIKTLKEIISDSKKYISEDLSFEEIKWLLKDIFSLEEYELITRSSRLYDDQKFMELLQKAQKIPVAYLLGYQEFFGFRLKVDKNVLIPRNETEELVKMTLDYAKNKKSKPLKILEIGTGSGCISIALNKELTKLNINNEITAVDISEEALVVAQENSKNLNCKIKFIKSDVCDQIEEKDFDIIVSNPPYISQSEYVSKRVLDNEPHLALFSDKTGLLVYEKIFSQIKDMKVESLFFEISPYLTEGLIKLKNKYLSNYSIEFRTDINGFKRFMILKLLVKS